MGKTKTTRSGRIFREATVSEVEDLTPRIRRLRFSGSTLKGIEWAPGQKIKIHANEALRSYTPARVDPEEGWMDVIFFLHGNGPASQWASDAALGETIQFIGPVKSVAGPKSTPDWALFLGDETAIGLAAALLEALPDSVTILGAIEVDASDSTAVAEYGLPLTAAIRNGTHGEPLLAWLNKTDLPEGHGMIWVSGEANSAKALKQALMARDPQQVQFKMKPYWSCKGHADRKAMKL